MRDSQFYLLQKIDSREFLHVSLVDFRVFATFFRYVIVYDISITDSVDNATGFSIRDKLTSVN